MKARSILSSAALMVATAIITTQVVSQEAKQPPAAPEMPPEMMEMMQKMTEAGTPGAAHQALENKVGKWNGKMKMWWSPDSPDAEESECTCTTKWVLNGRWLMENVEGNFGGETFVGNSLVGYDNVTKNYTSIWVDNMSTSLMTSEGTFDGAKKVATYATESTCPFAGKRVNGRTIERWIDDDTYVMEMYGPWYKTGKEFKSMEITFTRVK